MKIFTPLVLLPLIVFLVSCGSSAVKTQLEDKRATREAFGTNWVVSTQGQAATDAVDRIFKSGGNIIDAAIAASFAISVERPQSTGLGGGGFMLYREAKTGVIHAIDFRERAPKAAHEKMFLDSKGEVIPDRSLTGIHSAAVPGLVKGLSEIHRKFGKIEFSKTVQPAIELARSGVPVYPKLDEALKDEESVLASFPSSRKIFLKADGKAYEMGEKIVQSDLALSLEKIAMTHGKDFYSGTIARAIVKETKNWISQSDLNAYRVKWRKPVRSSFQGYEVVSMPPPSSGGVHLIEILNFLEDQPLKSLGFQSTASVHRIASAMQRAFLDRARYMGDPDYVSVPIKTLTSKAYAKESWKAFNPEHALTAEELGGKQSVLPEHSETTHFSIMDQEGNVVVSTQTINGWFGSKLVVPETGILLNNEMDDFSAKPGASNLFGAVGSKANAVHPGKTPLSSMSPTIVLENGKPRLALGAPGGTRIITCVTQVILNHLVYGLPLYESVAALRIHQQWKPDILRIEKPGLDPKTETDLSALGWKIEKGQADCAVMAVGNESGRLHGVSEPRDNGKALAR